MTLEVILFSHYLFEQMLAEQDNSAAADDTIKLTGLERVTYWTFPQINYCPHPNCQKVTIKSK